MKLDPCITLYTKLSSKWINNFNVTPETIKLLEENTWGKLHNIGLINDFFASDPKSTGNKSRDKQKGLLKIKIFCTEKETTEL